MLISTPSALQRLARLFAPGTGTDKSLALRYILLDGSIATETIRQAVRG